MATVRPSNPPSMPLVNHAALEAEVARLVRAELDTLRPALVSQRTVEAVVGLPRRDYLRCALAGAFPSFASPENKRLVLAKSADVIAHLLAHPRRQPANDVTRADLDAALRRVGARRVA